jgi:ATP phosphoribosyltransferase
MLTVAVQKTGRLSEKTLELLKDSGIVFQNGRSTKLKSTALNFPIQILYLRDDDIPEYVADAVADVGIVGENIFLEKEKNAQLVERLGFARCRLSIAIPKDRAYKNIADLNGLNIATAYPVILSKYLKKHGVKSSIHRISGSAEITPSVGLADAIFDIVSSGSTLMSNGLREVETVMSSEAILIANAKLNDEKKRILDKLVFRFRAVNKAKNYKYILLNTPNKSIDKLSKILPGMKSPTIMPLALEGWSSLHTVIQEDEFWEVIESLKKAGAQGILVTPIEKMII